MNTFLSLPNVLLAVIVLAIIGFVLGRGRARASVMGDLPKLHSRPIHHGWHVVLATAVPAILVLFFWSFLQGLVSNSILNANIDPSLPDLQIPEAQRALLSEETIVVREAAQRGLFAENVKTLASALTGAGPSVDIATSDYEALANNLRDAGQVVSADITPGMLDAALDLQALQTRLSMIGPAIAMVLAVGGFFWAFGRIGAEFRARNVVERWIMGFLIFASTMAILTTVAILAAVTVPSLTFFSEYGFLNFLFGFDWSIAGDVVGQPEGENGEYASQLGFMPLLWGTLYISFVALIVAVPLGLMAAIYLSEFATARFRAWVKPALEILAGVPTIVYGLFALVTVGPFLQAVVGTTIMPNTVSVITAGTVMGMMLVPFVSSLSDDVINSVPQAMRDGSLGLGATKSETVTKVILPAALPGIVGAIVLAASRAIGETMIVVLAAGALSSVSGLEANPFGAVVTVTTRIVAVLQGESSGFDSIDTLAVFALAFTLFFITLGLNLLAQRIVAKYREQYD